MSKYYNFSVKEFECPCCKLCFMDDRIIKMLNDLRKACGFPLSISSAYRCIDHNLQIDGNEDSMHVQGKAVDIKIHHLNSSKIKRLIEKIETIKFHSVVEFKDYIHVEISD